MGSAVKAIPEERERENAEITAEEAVYILDNVKVIGRDITPEVYNIACIKSKKAIKEVEDLKAAMNEIDQEIERNIKSNEEYKKGRVDGMLYAKYIIENMNLLTR